jgi:hypothetical protein
MSRSLALTFGCTAPFATDAGRDFVDSFSDSSFHQRASRGRRILPTEGAE